MRPGVRRGHEERDPVVASAVVVQAAQHHGLAAAAGTGKAQEGVDVDRVTLLEG